MVCKILNRIFLKIYRFNKKLYKLKFFGIKVGENLEVYGNVKIFGNRCNIFIGDNCSFNEGVILSANGKIIIGDNVTISSYTLLHTGFLDLDIFPIKQHIYKDIVIGNNVWIASGCIISGGVKIEDNVVIGANSVVLSDLEGGYFYAGSPARKIYKLKGFQK